MLTADQSVTAFKTAFLTGISDDEPRIPARRWFRRPSTGGPRVVPYSSIAANADKEYQDFLTMDPRIECTCNDYEQMKEWLTSTPHEEIVARMETIPSGLSGAPELGFTAAQRMYMLVTLYRPFSVTSRVYVSNQTMRDIASYRPSADSRFRKEPIEAQFSVPAGGLLDTNICELPTAAGKTSICCAIAGVALGPVYWNILKNEYQQKRVGGISQGAPVPYYARLCIINPAAGTFDHSATTLRRLIPTLEAMNPSSPTTCGPHAAPGTPPPRRRLCRRTTSSSGSFPITVPTRCSSRTSASSLRSSCSTRALWTCLARSLSSRASLRS